MYKNLYETVAFDVADRPGAGVTTHTKTAILKQVPTCDSAYLRRDVDDERPGLHLQAYLSGIETEVGGDKEFVQKNFCRFVMEVPVKDGGQYRREDIIVEIDDNGTVTIDRKHNKGFKPTKAEQKKIKEEWSARNYPTFIPTNEKEIEAYWRTAFEGRGTLELIYSMERLSDAAHAPYKVIMGQLRLDRPNGGKEYIPITQWSDLKFRKMEPPGLLPVWRDLQQVKHPRRTVLVEGPKAARVISKIIHWQRDENHPFYSFFKDCEFRGWLGGAPNWRRTDWNQFKEQPVLLISDNDEPGRKAVKDISAERLNWPHEIILWDDPRFPEKWDLADPIPVALFEDGEYIGPRIEDMIQVVEPLPTVIVKDGRDVEMVDECQGALVNMGGVYQRCGLIVKPNMVKRKDCYGNDTEQQVIHQMRDHALQHHICKAAKVFRVAEGGEHKPCTVPIHIIRQMCEVGNFKFPVLHGVIHCPTLRADGSLLTQPGYDRATGLIYDPDDLDLPAIPDRPTKEQAKAALEILKEPIAKFPFVDDASRSVTLSATLTAIIRGTLKTAPAYGYTAPTPGTGKSLLVDVTAATINGKRVAPVTWCDDDDENRKVIGASVLEGCSHIAIDNVDVDLKGAAFCELISASAMRPRILGTSDVPETPTNMLVTITGNNLTIIGDAVRRVVMCRLDAQVERPELREFNFEPVEMVLADRGRYVAAALTILRAYAVAGYPNPLPDLGGFGDWTKRVASALVWLGEANPIDTIEASRAEDPDLNDLRRLLAEWERAFKGGCVTVADAIKLAIDDEIKDPGFFQAIEAVASSRTARLDAQKLGLWLKKRNGQPLDGRAFEKGPADEHSKVGTWRVAKMVKGCKGSG